MNQDWLGLLWVFVNSWGLLYDTLAFHLCLECLSIQPKVSFKDKLISEYSALKEQKSYYAF